VSRATARLYMYRVERDWYYAMDRIQKGTKADAAQARKELREALSPPRACSTPSAFHERRVSLVDCCVAPLLWRLPVLAIELPPQAKSIKDYAKRHLCVARFRYSLTEAEKEMVIEAGA